MRIATLLLAFGIVGCSDIFGPDVEYLGRYPVRPLPEWGRWYGAVEECLGVRGDFAAVRWWIADEIRLDGVQKAGVLDFPNDITMWAEAVDVPWAIGHEASHHILQIGDALHDSHGAVPCQSVPM